MSRPYHFFCPVYFQESEILDNPHAASFLEDLLQLGSPNQIVPADLFDGDCGVDPQGKVIGHTAEDLGVAFTLGGLGNFGLRNFLWDRQGIRVPPDQMNQEMFQIEADKLLRAEHVRFFSGHILEVGVVQTAVEATPCLNDDAGKEVAFRLVNFKRFFFEKFHGVVFAVEGNYDQVGRNLPCCLYAVEFIGLVKGDITPL